MNTHNISSPRKPVFEGFERSCKLNEGTKLTCLAVALDITAQNAPSILMGDINIKPQEAIYDIMRKRPTDMWAEGRTERGRCSHHVWPAEACRNRPVTVRASATPCARHRVRHSRAGSHSGAATKRAAAIGIAIATEIGAYPGPSGGTAARTAARNHGATDVLTTRLDTAVGRGAQAALRTPERGRSDTLADDDLALAAVPAAAYSRAEGAPTDKLAGDQAVAGQAGAVPSTGISTSGSASPSKSNAEVQAGAYQAAALSSGPSAARPSEAAADQIATHPQARVGGRGSGPSAAHALAVQASAAQAVPSGVPSTGPSSGPSAAVPRSLDPRGGRRDRQESGLGHGGGLSPDVQC